MSKIKIFKRRSDCRKLLQHWFVSLEAVTFQSQHTKIGLGNFPKMNKDKRAFPLSNVINKNIEIQI